LRDTALAALFPALELWKKKDYTYIYYRQFKTFNGQIIFEVDYV